MHYSSLTPARCKSAIVNPIAIEAIPASLLFESVVATITNTKTNVKMTSTPKPCPTLRSLFIAVTPRLSCNDDAVTLYKSK